MFIDKVEPFYTDDDRRTIAQIEARLDAITKEAHQYTEEMKEAIDQGDEGRYQAIWEKSIALWDHEYQAATDDLNQLYEAIEQRYINSFKDNPAAILDDVREIVSAVSKEEYINYQKRTNEALKPLLDADPEAGKAQKAIKRQMVQGYRNCYYFILRRVAPQLRAMEFYQLDDAPVISMVEEKTRTFYIKPKQFEAAPLPAIREIQSRPARPENRAAMFTAATSPALNLIYDALTGDIDTLPDRRKRYSRSGQITVKTAKDDSSRKLITYTKNGDQINLQIDDIEKINNRNANAKKTLTRIMNEACSTCIHNGEVTNLIVSFSLRDLVESGQYKSTDAARRGCRDSIRRIMSFIVEGSTNTGKKIEQRQVEGAQLIIHYKISYGGIVEVTLNPCINWAFIAQYFTNIPKWYYELSGRAADLLWHIFYMARQNTRQIAETGRFYINYRTIQAKLNLPDENRVQNTKRDIKDPIEDAIEEIEETYRKYAPPIPKDATGNAAEPAFSLLPLADYDAPIEEYLNHGRLQVSLKGEYAERFIKISQATTTRIAQAEKVQQRAEIEARKKVITDQLKNKK